MIYCQPGRYIGWPSIVCRRNGELVTVFSGDRDAHVCPWGKTQLVRSADGGETWTEPLTINNTPLDDRDAGIIETVAGTLLVSWFTSLAFTESRHVDWQKVPPLLAESWRRHADKLGQETRSAWLGNWVRRSTDGGRTWGAPIRTAVSAPHGPIQLRDGRLLYVGTTVLDGASALGVEESRDDGRSWHLIGTLPTPPDRSAAHYHEPHVAEPADGRLVALIRYQPPDSSQCYLQQSESADGGASWTVAQPTPMWGYPPHLLALRNGWLLAVYGHRRPPFGERACVSRDGGATWDIAHEVVLCEAANDDLGYPCTAELPDGSLLTVYYQDTEQAKACFHRTCLLATRWRVGEDSSRASACLTEPP